LQRVIFEDITSIKISVISGLKNNFFFVSMSLKKN